MSIFGSNLKTIRESWDLSQAEFGFIVNASRGMIMQYENRETLPRPKVLGAIVSQTGFTKDILLNMNINPEDVQPLTMDQEIALDIYRNDPESFNDTDEDRKELLSTFSDKLSKKVSQDSLIPYYNVEATAGQLNVFGDEPEVPSYNLSIPAFADCDFAVNVAGHSMYPRYCNGDIIICKRLKNLNVIPPGEVYLIVTDEQRLLKVIKNGENKDVFLLASENPKFEAFELNKEEIKQLYLVKGKIERNQI